MALTAIKITSDGQMYDSEGNKLNDPKVQSINGSAISLPTGVEIQQKDSLFESAFDIAGWLIHNWQLAILGAFAVYLLLVR